LITVRRAHERLHTRIGWLDSRHTFTFEEHIDPRHMGFRALRVLNEDRIVAARGFGMQPQRDMEILTWVLTGTLRHEDSLGTRSVLNTGEVQCMSAGTGVLHSEFNASATEPLHLLQAWITPSRSRLAPRYQSRPVRPDDNRSRVALVASADGSAGSLTVNQDIRVYTAHLDAAVVVSHALCADRHAWLQVIRGRLELDGVELKAGDGAAIDAASSLQMRALSACHTLLFDLA
jgi:redox-sensitive bicupin YhaK (pirin superfamily)